MRQIILDTETTGLEPEKGHRIIEIGCVEMRSRILTGKNFHTYLNPEREIDRGAVAIHGLTNAFLSDKPKFSQISEAFLRYIDGAQLVAHNASFDIAFLDHELMRLNPVLGRIRDYCDVIDTLQIARELHPGQRVNLDALCKRYSIDNSHRDFHGALLDAQILAQVYLVMTGGQEVLFSDHDEIAATSSQLHDAISTSSAQWDLTVLHATDAELAEHKKYLEKLQKDSGEKCVWLAEERQ